jgi:hypothetical protein
MSQRLTLSAYLSPGAPIWDNGGSYRSTEPQALLRDEFIVTLKQDATYDIYSESYYDPHLLRIENLTGDVLASDNEVEPVFVPYGTDRIYQFKAPYTGDYCIFAGWKQGSDENFVRLAVYEDVDTANIDTAYGVVNRNDGDPLFDRSYYLSVNRDVKVTNMDPLLHYASYGWREGRDPSAWFATEAYLAANPDVRAARLSPLEHYRAWGWREGRDPSLNFDIERYFMSNPDVRAAGIDPLGHWIDYGRVEGRAIPADAVGSVIIHGFDLQFYLMSNLDVARAGIDPFQHYHRYGWQEGRKPNRWLDSTHYLEQNSDVAGAGVDPLSHYITYGWKEGRNPGPDFDTKLYLKSHGDVSSSGMNPLEHFLLFGHSEGRQPLGNEATL